MPHARRLETHRPPKVLYLRNGHGYAREHELPFTSPSNEQQRQFQYIDAPAPSPRRPRKFSRYPGVKKGRTNVLVILVRLPNREYSLSEVQLFRHKFSCLNASITPFFPSFHPRLCGLICGPLQMQPKLNKSISYNLCGGVRSHMRTSLRPVGPDNWPFAGNF